MPVVGLPTAVDMMLTSLLATDELSSWKVAGEPGVEVVLVLRFRPSDGQPLQTNDTHRRGQFRRKPPCQVLRDRKRAQRHREVRRGEQASQTVEYAVNSAVDSNVDFPVDAARTSHASTSFCPRSPTTLTFAPMCDTAVSTADKANEPENSVCDNVPTNSLSAKTVSVATDQSSSEREEWLRDFRAIVHDMLNGPERTAEDGGRHTATIDIARPEMDPGEDVSIAVDTLTIPPSAEVVPGKLSDPTHPAPDPPATRTPSTPATMQTSHQDTPRHNKPGDTSCGSCSMITRSRSSARPRQRQQHSHLLRK